VASPNTSRRVTLETRWLRTADDLLVWIMILDRLVATQSTGGGGR